VNKYHVHLRYYVGDPLEEIKAQDLDGLAGGAGVTISHEQIDNRTMSDGLLREETLGRAIEEITQDVITVSSDDEQAFREALAAVYARYRSPRTPYAFWGSSSDGARLAREVAEQTGGGW
jgi:hypothetical protein